MDLGQFIIQNFNEFLTYTAFANATVGNLIMIAVGAFFIWLATVLTLVWRSVFMRTTPC